MTTDISEHMVSNPETTEDLQINSVEEGYNSDMDILDIKRDMCEDDMLKHICYQILDRIEFEFVPGPERDALCKIIMNRGLMDLKEGRVTSA